ncbi:ABC transporter permease [Vagococcus sp. WN89Y]|uniref:ABC transporter permease n=1 Tax=Vagococcus sp. WN89Y TaxID=3457258 RepID=UPI003FCEC72D
MVSGIGIINGCMIIISGFLFWSFFFRLNDVKFVFLNLFRHKRRSLSALAAIMLGGSAIFLYGGFIDYSFWLLKEQTIRTNIGHVQVYRQNYFDTANKNQSLIENYQKLKADILSDVRFLGEISAFSGQLEFTGIVSQYESATSNYFSALGIEPFPALKLGAFDKIVSGSDLSRIKKDEVTLGSGLANTLGAKYGDWLDIIAVNIHGGQSAISLKARGIFSSGIKEYDDVMIKIPLDTAQRMMETGGVNKISILLTHDDIASFTQKLRKYISERKLPLIVKEWSTISLFYSEVESLLSGVYFFIKLLVGVIIMFMINNIINMNIIERTREITTLRAMGLRPLHVTRLFVLEGVFIGFTGAMGSLALGFLISSIINHHGIVMPPSPGKTQGYVAFIKNDTISLAWMTFIFPVVTATLASFFPAMRAAKLNIADAFKFSQEG